MFEQEHSNISRSQDPLDVTLQEFNINKQAFG